MPNNWGTFSTKDNLDIEKTNPQHHSESRGVSKALYPPVE